MAENYFQEQAPANMDTARARSMMMLKWQRLRGAYRTKDGWVSEKEIDRSTPVLHRAKIPGGWLVMMQQYDAQTGANVSFGYGFGGMTFVPDPNHEWDGSSP